MPFTEAARHDFLQAASYLVLGVAAAAALHVVVPRWVCDHLTAHLILGVVVMAALAVVLALCSEADAFVAAGMTMVPLLPRLVFLVVGPAVDMKLFAMQAGVFGRAFATRFAPATLLVAIGSACAVGLLVLGGRWLSRETENTVLLLVGIRIAMLTVSGAFTRYVKPGLLPWLTVSAVLLIVLALAAVIGDIRRGGPLDHGDHGEGPSHRAGMVWFLLVRILLLIFVTPPALRPSAASVTAVSNAVVNRAFPPLPPGRAPEVSLPEILMREAQDTTGSLTNRVITVTGFVLNETQGRTLVASSSSVAPPTPSWPDPSEGPGRSAGRRAGGQHLASGRGRGR